MLAAYAAAVRAARARLNAINLAAAREIDAALVAYANELAARVLRLPPDAALAARAAEREVRTLSTQLEGRIADATARGAALAFDGTRQEWAAASARVAALDASGAVPGASLGRVPLPAVPQAHAFLASAQPHTWRTLLRGHVQTAAQDVTRTITRALVQGVGPDRLARALRPYVAGRDRAPAVLAEAIEGAPTAIRGAAPSLNHNAQRIAFTETHNARREAEVAAFDADPAILLVRWTLSPRRGTQRLPDACDALARLDWWGLGAGVYPAARVPTAPHPWDRCEVVPLTARDLTEAARALLRQGGTLRPVLDPATVALPGAAQLTANAVQRTRRALAAVLPADAVALAPRAA